MFNVLTGILILAAMFTFTACEEENLDQTDVLVTYDCPDIQADYGDICIVDSAGVIFYGIIDASCQCNPQFDSTMFDCPSYFANIGEPCPLDLTGSEFGVLDQNCNCINEDYYRGHLKFQQ